MRNTTTVYQTYQRQSEYLTPETNQNQSENVDHNDEKEKTTIKNTYCVMNVARCIKAMYIYIQTTAKQHIIIMKTYSILNKEEENHNEEDRRRRRYCVMNAVRCNEAYIHTNQLSRQWC